MRHTTYTCDCCGSYIHKVGSNPNDTLYATVIYGEGRYRIDYCYDCGSRILKSMSDECSNLRKEQLSNSMRKTNINKEDILSAIASLSDCNGVKELKECAEKVHDAKQGYIGGIYDAILAVEKLFNEGNDEQ